MKELVSLIESGMDWRSYDAHFPFWKRPPKDLFLDFVAKALENKHTALPSAISLRIVRSWSGNHLYVIGTLHNGDEVDRVAGEVVWMPNLNNFRGHLFINPPSGEDLLLEDIAELHKQEWHLAKWAPLKPKQTHDHCRICWQTFCEVGESIEMFAYTDDNDWVCQKCYVEHLQPTAN